MLDATEIIGLFVSGTVFGCFLCLFIVRMRSASNADLSNTFEALAAKTFHANAENFLQLAEIRFRQSEQSAAATLEKKSTAIDEIIKPVKESLQKMDTQLHELEVKREGAYREMLEVVQASRETHQQLRGETSQLLQALRSPTTRGRWGEMQLKRILEITGMSLHAKDFSVQQSINDGQLRPDIIVNLPSNHCIVIDSKVPLSGFLDAAQSTDEAVRQAAFRQHALHVRAHVKALSAKAYWSQIDGTPEFVVLFLPGDHFLSAALDNDPDLMDFSFAQKVVLATPVTLFSLLRAVAYGWRQESLSENARKVGVLGSELYGALLTMTEHFTALGTKLSGSVDSYNKMLGSLERNVVAKARKLRDYGAGKEGKMLPDELNPIDLTPRSINLIGDNDPNKADAA